VGRSFVPSLTLSLRYRIGIWRLALVVSVAAMTHGFFVMAAMVAAFYRWFMPGGTHHRVLSGRFHHGVVLLHRVLSKYADDKKHTDYKSGN
jgi:hypothetical protein